MKRLAYILSFSLLLIGAGSMQSCARKSGCPAYETTKTKPKRNGELRKRKGKSELFPKKMRRAQKRRRG